jgi:hypothetical protein
MKTRLDFVLRLALVLAIAGTTLMMAQRSPAGGVVPPHRPQGSCDIYAAAGDPCVAAHSTTRALYATYNGPLYQVLRQSDGKTLDIGVVQASATSGSDPGGYADAAAQDKFCSSTYCWISIIYDQSPKHNDLVQAPRGGFSGPALGGFNNLPIADMAPITVMGHKVYGVFIEPGMGLRQNDVKGTAVDDQAEGQYWVVSGKHFNAGCCFDYGNAEIDSRDDDNGTMETLYFGNATPWYSGAGHGPWIMTDQENNLVGCVNDDGTKGCPNLPSIPWRFVTAIGKGEPHHWTSMGGDAQKGPLSVMFDGHRVNPTYDPMRKQGAILLGNGGDNSVGSQGTFYEGAMTAAGTFPSDTTDQLVQANVVAARYDVAALTLVPSATTATHITPRTFTPGSSQDFTVTFTNTTGAPAVDVRLSVPTPSRQWSATVSGTAETAKTFAQPIVPGASVSATFKITSAPESFNGDLVAQATWVSPARNGKLVETTVAKIRNAAPVKVNEFRVTSGAPGNLTDSFIELYNAGSQSVDLSNWSLTEHPAHQAIFSTVKIPAGTRLAPGGFYLLGLSNSGLAIPASAGESIIHVRSVQGMSVGDTIDIDAGAGMELRRIVSLGTAASNHTTVWQSLPDDLVLTVPAGSTNVPVEEASGFVAGQKIALGYGSTYPIGANTEEHYEIATVTTVGKRGTQAYLAMEASAGATKIQVTSLSDISVGDKIRLDVDSVGHGIETVTVTGVGTAASQTNLSAPASVGATRISVRRGEGFAAGHRITIGTPASRQVVTVIAVGAAGPDGTLIDFTPSLTTAHVAGEWVVSLGTGLTLAAPLRFNHSANLPFSDRGTGISFQPATTFTHSSNEPVQALGTGITLDRPLTNSHAIYAAVRDVAVSTAGYQGSPAPNQWFGGPELITKSPQFDRVLTVEEGSMVLRDPSGVVADSLNYGGLVDPWAAEGDQGVSGAELSGCYTAAPGSVFNPWSTVVASVAMNTSAGRFPDGADTDSNCADFRTQTAASLAAQSARGATNIKVTSTRGFHPGQTVHIDPGADTEAAVIAVVGTAGATAVRTPTNAGATLLRVESVTGFVKGQTITIDDAGSSETAVVASMRARGADAITVVTPLARSHAAGAQISGSGISLVTPLTRTHPVGAQISDSVPTPGAPNQFNEGTH